VEEMSADSGGAAGRVFCLRSQGLPQGPPSPRNTTKRAAVDSIASRRWQNTECHPLNLKWDCGWLPMPKSGILRSQTDRSVQRGKSLGL